MQFAINSRGLIPKVGQWFKAIFLKSSDEYDSTTVQPVVIVVAIVFYAVLKMIKFNYEFCLPLLTLPNDWLQLSNSKINN